MATEQGKLRLTGAYMGLFADVVDALVEEYLELGGACVCAPDRERLVLEDFAAWVKEAVDNSVATSA